MHDVIDGGRAAAVRRIEGIQTEKHRFFENAGVEDEPERVSERTDSKVRQPDTNGYRLVGTDRRCWNANSENAFRYDAQFGTSGGYIFNMSTKDWPPVRTTYDSGLVSIRFCTVLPFKCGRRV